MATSVSSGIFQQLFFTYMAIALVVGGLVIGWLLYAIWRFREKPGAPRPRDAPVPGMIPAERGHVLWTYVMAGTIAAIMFGLAFSTISAVKTLETPPEGVPAIHTNVTGFQFGWRFNYTGEGGIPFSRIGEFTVPTDTPIVINVTSTDVWHNFALPDYRIRIDAVPGEVNPIWFQANEPAETHVACVQICGSGHALMRANVHVLAKTDYEAWLAKESKSEYERLVKRGAVRNVTAQDGAFTLDRADAKPGEALAINVTNVDIADLVLPGGRALAPGDSAFVYTVAPTDGHLEPYAILGCPPGGNCK